MNILEERTQLASTRHLGIACHNPVPCGFMCFQLYLQHKFQYACYDTYRHKLCINGALCELVLEVWGICSTATPVSNVHTIDSNVSRSSLVEAHKLLQLNSQNHNRLTCLPFCRGSAWSRSRTLRTSSPRWTRSCRPDQKRTHRGRRSMVKKPEHHEITK